MAAIYTVSQLNNEIKDLLDAVPGYRSLLVQGEISNYKAHSSGHHYMTLKDRDAAINAVMFRSDAMRLKFRLENGMKVIVRARVSSFPRTGAVQLYISEIIPDGAGPPACGRRGKPAPCETALHADCRVARRDESAARAEPRLCGRDKGRTGRGRDRCDGAEGRGCAAHPICKRRGRLPRDPYRGGTINGGKDV